jgi:mannose-6-phosphate isomerase-like protein (cupin superfamily)
MALTGDKAMVFSAQQIQAQLAQSAAAGGTTLAVCGNLALKTSVRTTSGGAEIHAHFDDLMIVEQGSATLVTGGAIVDAKTGADGETKGSAIQGGLSRIIRAGDVVIVSAGEPHQLLIPPGTVYGALVAKIKEP